MQREKEEISIQALLSLSWIAAGILLGFCLSAFDILLCFESQYELFASLSRRSVGFLSGTIFAEGLIFWLSAKIKTVSATIISLIVCLALVGFGIEVSGFPDIHYAGSDRFSGLVYHQPWYKISVLVLFSLPLIFWLYHAFKRRISEWRQP